MRRLRSGFAPQQAKTARGRIDQRAVAGGARGPQPKARDQMLDQLHEELLGQDRGGQDDKLADGAVVGLMAAAHPPRAYIAARQCFKLAQRPLPVENPVDDKTEQRARMEGLAPDRLIASGLHCEIQLGQQGAQPGRPAQTGLTQVIIQTLRTDEQLVRLRVEEQIIFAGPLLNLARRFLRGTKVKPELSQPLQPPRLPLHPARLFPPPLRLDQRPPHAAILR